MYEHYKLDNPPKGKPAGHDPEYDKEEPDTFHDPDFDDEWDSLDEGEPQPTPTPVKLDKGIVPENPPEANPEEEVLPSIEGVSIKDKGKWEEVD